jgi:hypothetical protein
MKDAAKPHKYLPVGRCIYCGGVAGHIEHVVPDGIGGKLELPDASCKGCGTITSQFEGKVQRDLLGIVRERHKWHKHPKRKRPAQFVELRANGESDVIERRIPAAEVPGLLNLPLFGWPSVLRGEMPTGELSIQTVIRPTYHGALHDFANMISGYHASFGKYDPLPFARMLAKIAHTFAVGELGLDAFRQFYLQKLIRGDYTLDPDKWVGSYPDDVRGDLHTVDIDPNMRHELTLRTSRQSHGISAVTVDIRLFANYGGPKHIVVVGEIVD